MLIEYQNTIDDLREATAVVTQAKKPRSFGGRAIGFAVSMIAYSLLIALLAKSGSSIDSIVLWIHLIVPIGALMMLAASIAIAATIRGHRKFRLTSSLIGWILFIAIVGLNLWLMRLSPRSRSPSIGALDWKAFLPHAGWLFLVAWIGYTAIRNQSSAIQKSWDSQPELHRPHTADISVDGITTTDALCRKELRWLAFMRWEETDHLFLLFVSQTQCLMLPKRSFHGEEELAAFRAMARMITGGKPTGFPVQPVGEQRVTE